MSASKIVADRHPFFWLPNALTVSRIVAIPLVVWGILATADIVDAGPVLDSLVPWRATLALFIYCMITDFLDGKLARRWNLVSGFGRMLDPIADKLLVAGALIAFCVTSGGNWLVLIPALLIIGRDISVSGAREHAALSNIVMSPTNLAKWKTSFEFIAIVLLLLSTASATWLPIAEGIRTFHGTVTPAALATLWLAAALSVWTGAGYIRQALKS